MVLVCALSTLAQMRGGRVERAAVVFEGLPQGRGEGAAASEKRKAKSEKRKAAEPQTARLCATNTIFASAFGICSAEFCLSKFCGSSTSKMPGVASDGRSVADPSRAAMEQRCWRRGRG